MSFISFGSPQPRSAKIRFISLDPRALVPDAAVTLTQAEISYGTIGPSLFQFGKTRGYTEEMRKYVYAKVYNSEAFNACSNMPRFGHNGILTEQQMKDLTALLLDPASPVNQ